MMTEDDQDANEKSKYERREVEKRQSEDIGHGYDVNNNMPSVFTP